MLVKLLILLGLPVLALGASSALQDRMVYQPQRYTFPVERLAAPLVALSFDTADGRQYAVWVPPASGRLDRLWMVTGGNAMVALQWVPWLQGQQDADAGFLLIDYPGYGWNEGLPSAAGTQRNVAGAQAALTALLGHDLPAPLLLGHSLGAAVALRTAVSQPVSGIVLSAPFASLPDAAAHHFGGWVKLVVRRDFDNQARLAELDAQRPPTILFHGTEDEVIPFAQGEALAGARPWIQFRPVAGAHHNDLLMVAREEVRAAMRTLVAGVTDTDPEEGG